MVRDIAQFLKKLILKESSMLVKENVKHPGIIGQMYEGLTKDVLKRTIPPQLNLKIASGIIINEHGDQSKQIDCMVVEGDGEKIPHTDEYKYHIHDVLAVIEVKKNLYSSDLESSYNNLLSVLKIITPKDIRINLLRDSFRGITRRLLPDHDKVKDLPYHLEMIYHVLVAELLQPLRIVFGYNGFASELNLRKSFYNFLTNNLFRKGFGPASFPHLIIGGKYTLVKLNGMPFSVPMEKDYWEFYGSSKENPLIFLIELIFTRLTYLNDISIVGYGDDLKLENINRFLSAKYITKGSLSGWDYKASKSSKEGLDYGLEPEEWRPIKLDQSQFTIINELCKDGEIDLNDKSLQNFISNHGYTIDSFIDSLKKKNIATVENDKLVLLTDECLCCILPTDDFVAGENKSGRMTRWVEQFMKKYKKSNNGIEEDSR
jgi:hypothetical protein